MLNLSVKVVSPGSAFEWMQSALQHLTPNPSASAGPNIKRQRVKRKDQTANCKLQTADCKRSEGRQVTSNLSANNSLTQQTQQSQHTPHSANRVQGMMPLSSFYFPPLALARWPVTATVSSDWRRVPPETCGRKPPAKCHLEVAGDHLPSSPGHACPRARMLLRASGDSIYRSHCAWDEEKGSKKQRRRRRGRKRRKY